MLAPADDLSTFHAARFDLYSATFELLRRPPREKGFDELRRGLDGGQRRGGHRALGELQQALAGASVGRAAQEYGELFLGPNALRMRCRRPGCEVRGEAFASAEVLATEERVAEINVLSLLAGRTTQALAARRIPEAAAFSDVQGRFLSHHAGTCLGDLAGELRESGLSFFARVGAALGWLIHDDLEFLGYPDAPR
jgi:uncharacterized protein (DUF1501 family)